VLFPNLANIRIIRTYENRVREFSEDFAELLKQSTTYQPYLLEVHRYLLA
jgi:hypothetical protein